MTPLTTRAVAFSCVLALVFLSPLAALAQGGGQGRGAAVQAPGPTGERVRVKTGHANVHMGPTSTQEVLVLAPRGTILPVLGRRGEWVQVGLSPALRKTGMVLRWYKNETNGWMHDSMLDVVKPGL
jgi:uncharacterized protein YgiM (DUF1202 family)